MKFLILLALCLGTLSASATSIHCREILPRTTHEVQRPVYLVNVYKIADLNTSNMRDVDAAWSVRVHLVQTLGTNVVVNQVFDSVAKMYDVHFKVDATKTNGFYLNLYMDELNQTTFSQTDTRGNRREVRLNCDWKE